MKPDPDIIRQICRGMIFQGDRDFLDDGIPGYETRTRGMETLTVSMPFLNTGELLRPLLTIKEDIFL